MAGADHRSSGNRPIETQAPDRPPLGRRLLWFIGLWVAGVGAVVLVGLVIKLMLKG
jgi:hypothetical protein